MQNSPISSPEKRNNLVGLADQMQLATECYEIIQLIRNDLLPYLGESHPGREFALVVLGKMNEAVGAEGRQSNIVRHLQKRCNFIRARTAILLMRAELVRLKKEIQVTHNALQ